MTLLWIIYAVIAAGSFVPWARVFYNREPGSYREEIGCVPPEHLGWAFSLALVYSFGCVPPEHLGWAFSLALVYSLCWPTLLVFVLGFCLVHGVAWFSKLRPVRRVLNKIVGA